MPKKSDIKKENLWKNRHFRSFSKNDWILMYFRQLSRNFVYKEQEVSLPFLNYYLYNRFTW